MEKKKGAIVLLAYGRGSGLDAMVAQTRKSFPEHTVYCGDIGHKISLGEGLENVFSKIWGEGISHVVIQPLYMLSGVTHEGVLGMINRWENRFEQVVLGRPFLGSGYDMREAANCLLRLFPNQEQVLWMGHGSTHGAHACYHQLARILEEESCGRMVLATLREKECFTAFGKLGQNLVLAPFLMLGGAHMKRDVLEGQESWLTMLTQRGFVVTPIAKGLLEYEEIREAFCFRIQVLLQ